MKTEDHSTTSASLERVYSLEVDEVEFNIMALTNEGFEDNCDFVDQNESSIVMIHANDDCGTTVGREHEIYRPCKVLMVHRAEDSCPQTSQPIAEHILRELVDVLEIEELDGNVTERFLTIIIWSGTGAVI